MPPEPLFLLLLFLAAVAAGVINTLAGGGTLITFPSLVRFGGFPPRDAEVIANATNTFGVVPGSLAGAWGFRKELEGTRPWLLLLLPPSVLGGVAGSLLLTRLPASYFATLVPWLLLTAALLFLIQPRLTKFLPERPADRLPSWPVCSAVVVFQFLVAVYGGYFGAGIGVLMLSALGLMGLGDLHRMNAVKNLLAAVINGVSVVVFTIDNKINFPLGLLMAAGTLIGGVLGARLGRRLPRPLIRWFVILVGLGLSAYYFIKPGP